MGEYKLSTAAEILRIRYL